MGRIDLPDKVRDEDREYDDDGHSWPQSMDAEVAVLEGRAPGHIVKGSHG